MERSNLYLVPTYIYIIYIHYIYIHNIYIHIYIYIIYIYTYIYIYVYIISSFLVSGKDPRHHWWITRSLASCEMHGSSGARIGCWEWRTCHGFGVFWKSRLFLEINGKIIFRNLRINAKIRKSTEINGN